MQKCARLCLGSNGGEGGEEICGFIDLLRHDPIKHVPRISMADEIGRAHV